jgi:hypothetical protein
MSRACCVSELNLYPQFSLSYRMMTQVSVIAPSSNWSRQVLDKYAVTELILKGRLSGCMIVESETEIR